MKLYFLSSRPCALSFNNTYFGITDDFARSVDLSLRDNTLITFTPEDAQPIHFFLTENIQSIPPNGCEVFLLRDGIAVYARDFPPNDFSLKIIAQQRHRDCLATVFQQGNIQLTLDTPQGMFISHLPPTYALCDITFHEDYLLLKGTAKTPNTLTVYALNGCLLLQEQVIEFSIDKNILNATLPLSDRLGRTANCIWELSQTSARQTQYHLRQFRSLNEYPTKESIEQELLAFAFFESVLIGANFKDMLSVDLQGDCDKIKGFLGDFSSVILTDIPDTCGLVKKCGERLFKVEYFTLSIQNGKIADIHQCH